MTDEILFTSVAPVIPVRDIEIALDRYRQLGFTVHAYEGPERYGYAIRGDVTLHLTAGDHHDPSRDGAVVYLFVSDADALHAEWSAAGVPGRLIDPYDTPYGLREFAFVDKDGTAHRVGSPLPPH